MSVAWEGAHALLALWASKG